MREARSVLIVRDEVDMKKGRKMRPYSKFGDSVGNRTPVAAVRGLSLNRWTTEPKHYYIIIRVLFCLLFFILLKKIYEKPVF